MTFRRQSRGMNWWTIIFLTGINFKWVKAGENAFFFQAIIRYDSLVFFFFLTFFVLFPVHCYPEKKGLTCSKFHQLLNHSYSKIIVQSAIEIQTWAALNMASLYPDQTHTPVWGIRKQRFNHKSTTNHVDIIETLLKTMKIFWVGRGFASPLPLINKLSFQKCNELHKHKKHEASLEKKKK